MTIQIKNDIIQNQTYMSELKNMKEIKYNFKYIDP